MCLRADCDPQVIQRYRKNPSPGRIGGQSIVHPLLQLSLGADRLTALAQLIRLFIPVFRGVGYGIGEKGARRRRQLP
jgi:hypothetical protein